MKFKEAICSGLQVAIAFGGMTLMGAFAALWGREIGREDGMAIAYAECAREVREVLDNIETSESEKEES